MIIIAIALLRSFYAILHILYTYLRETISACDMRSCTFNVNIRQHF